MSEHKHPSGLTKAEVWYRYTRYPPLLAKLATFGLALAVLYLAFSTVEAVLFPVLLSLLVAYLLDPTIDWFEERGFSRTVAILGFLVAGIGFITLYALFLYPTIAHQIGKISNGLPGLIDRVENDLLPWVENTTGIDVPHNFAQALATYGATVQAQIPTITKAASTAFGSIWTRMGTVVASAVNIVMIPIFTFYFLRDFDKMRLSLAEFIPVKDRDFYIDRIQRMDEVVGAWFRGQVEVAVILSVLYAAGLAFVFAASGVGAGAGIAIGVLAGLLNIIPYFGFLIGFVLSLMMVLLEWNGILPVVGVLAVFAIVQGLEGYVITPRIVGEKVGLSPVVVIIALLLGNELLGLVGILLALPIAGIMRVLSPDFIAWYKASSMFTGEVDPRGANRSFIDIARAAQAVREAEAPGAASVTETPPSVPPEPEPDATAQLPAELDESPDTTEIEPLETGETETVDRTVPDPTKDP